MALRRATAMTAPSRASLSDIGRHYPGALNPTLIPNGVDARQFGRVSPAVAAAARARYQLPERFILAVGAHRPHKNHEVLVRAMTAVPNDVGLVIVGNPDPAFPDRLPGLITGLGLESRVKLVADVADEWLPAMYQAASVGFGVLHPVYGGVVPSRRPVAGRRPGGSDRAEAVQAAGPAFHSRPALPGGHRV